MESTAAADKGDKGDAVMIAEEFGRATFGIELFAPVVWQVKCFHAASMLHASRAAAAQLSASCKRMLWNRDVELASSLPKEVIARQVSLEIFAAAVTMTRHARAATSRQRAEKWIASRHELEEQEILALRLLRRALYRRRARGRYLLYQKSAQVLCYRLLAFGYQGLFQELQWVALEIQPVMKMCFTRELFVAQVGGAKYLEACILRRVPRMTEFSVLRPACGALQGVVRRALPRADHVARVLSGRTLADTVIASKERRTMADRQAAVAATIAARSTSPVQSSTKRIGLVGDAKTIAEGGRRADGTDNAQNVHVVNYVNSEPHTQSSGSKRERAPPRPRGIDTPDLFMTLTREAWPDAPPVALMSRQHAAASGVDGQGPAWLTATAAAASVVDGASDGASARAARLNRNMIAPSPQIVLRRCDALTSAIFISRVTDALPVLTQQDTMIAPVHDGVPNPPSRGHHNIHEHGGSDSENRNKGIDNNNPVPRREVRVIIELRGNLVDDGCVRCISALLEERPLSGRMEGLVLGCADIAACSDKAVRDLARALSANKTLARVTLDLSRVHSPTVSDEATQSVTHGLLAALMLHPSARSLTICGAAGAGAPAVAAMLAPALGWWNGLTELKIARNHLSPSDMKLILTSIRGCATLTLLDVAGNCGGLEIVPSLVALIESAPRLHSVICGENGVTVEGFTALIDAVHHRATLAATPIKHFDVSDEGTGDEVIPPLIRLLEGTPPAWLRFRANNFGPNCSWEICKALESCRYIVVLDLSGNNLRTEGARRVGIALANNTTLRSLSMESNAIGDLGAGDIATMGLVSNSVLEELFLGGNGIGDVGAVAIAGALVGRAPSSPTKPMRLRGMTAAAASICPLRTLSLRHNRIADEGARALSEAIVAGSTIEWLDLSGNCIGPQGGEALAMPLCQHIVGLRCGANRLGELGVSKLADAIGRVGSRCSVIDLADNGAPTDAVRWAVQATAKNVLINDIVGVAVHGARAQLNSLQKQLWNAGEHCRELAMLHAKTLYPHSTLLRFVCDATARSIEAGRAHRCPAATTCVSSKLAQYATAAARSGFDRTPAPISFPIVPPREGGAAVLSSMVASVMKHVASNTAQGGRLLALFPAPCALALCGDIDGMANGIADIAKAVSRGALAAGASHAVLITVGDLGAWSADSVLPSISLSTNEPPSRDSRDASNKSFQRPSEFSFGLLRTGPSIGARASEAYIQDCVDIALGALRGDLTCAVSNSGNSGTASTMDRTDSDISATMTLRDVARSMLAFGDEDIAVAWQGPSTVLDMRLIKPILVGVSV